MITTGNWLDEYNWDQKKKKVIKLIDSIVRSETISINSCFAAILLNVSSYSDNIYFGIGKKNRAININNAIDNILLSFVHDVVLSNWQ
jgi:hypothetical protein